MTKGNALAVFNDFKIRRVYDEKTETSSGFWDWYQIGGRWSGAHGTYNPEDDPENIEICTICHGSGFRIDPIGQDARDKDPSYTCNGCGEYDGNKGGWTHSKYGAGMKLKWATEWKENPGDITPVKDIPEDMDCYTLIIGHPFNEAMVYHREEWNGESFKKTEFDGNVKKQLEKLGIKSGYLVTVDYHC